MDFTEIIGFIIVLFVFLLPLLRKLLIDKKKVEQQKTEVEEEIFEEEEEETVVEPPPPLQTASPVYAPARTVKRDYEFEFDLEARQFLSKISSRKLETHIAPEFRERIVSENFILEKLTKKGKKNPLVSLIRKQDPGRTMVILSEIFNRKFE